MTKKYRGCESYAHLYSKQILKDWLISKWSETTLSGDFDVFSWNAPYSDPDRGVRLEYPIIEVDKSYLGMDPVWTTYPNLEKVKEAGKTISAVIDLVILSDGKPKYGLEVVHKHNCSNTKLVTLAKLKHKYGFQVYEINTSWILDQIQRPASFGHALDKKN